MTLFVEVAVLAPTAKSVFHYHLPEGFPAVAPGHLVVVPFGGRRVQGIMLGGLERPEVAETKPVEALVDRQPVFQPPALQLAKWMAFNYRSTLDECLFEMLPPGLASRAESVFELADSGAPADTPAAEKLIHLLSERGPLRTGQIRRALSRTLWEREAERLVRRGVLRRQSILPPPAVRPKHIRTVQLALAPDEAVRIMADLRRGELAETRKAAAGRRALVLDSLLAEGRPMAAEWVYAASGAALPDLKWMAEEGWVDLGYEEALRDPLAGRSFPEQEAVEPTAEQAAALRAIRAAIQARSPGRFLLHGITGSGKTEVYLLAAELARAAGRQSIILVPEIALTPQMVQRIGARFPGRLALLHSRLTPGERYDTWRRARSGLVDVVLGPRSSLFAPLPDIGLIVLDEEHDESYKSGTPPFYHARETALEYARILGAPCVLGSATPDLVTFYRAGRGDFTLLPLTARVSARRAPGAAPELPAVQIVDMRAELRAGNRSMFSRALSTALETTLARGEQAILFLNRRGTASAMVCRSCGAAVACPRCGIPLTVHDAGMLCHHCNYRRAAPARCPACGSEAIRALGGGTRQVEAEVQRLFPRARTLRWDRDAVEEAGEHEILLEHFASHRADVLVGTQMIAKGLDLPSVTLVGMVLADVGLLLPDYRSAERTFQLLTQVAGRAGRGERAGSAVLQTYRPDHYAITFAAGHDYAGFARRELEERRGLGYPPFYELVRLLCVDPNEGRAQREAEHMAGRLRERIRAEDRRETSLIGPVPCFFGKINGRFRWQVILRGPRPGTLIDLPLPAGWQVDVDPVNLL